MNLQSVMKITSKYALTLIRIYVRLLTQIIARPNLISCHYVLLAGLDLQLPGGQCIPAKSNLKNYDLTSLSLVSNSHENYVELKHSLVYVLNHVRVNMSAVIQRVYYIRAFRRGPQHDYKGLN